MQKKVVNLWQLLILSMVIFCIAVLGLLAVHFLQHWQPKPQIFWLRLLENGVESELGGVYFGMTQQDVEEQLGLLQGEGELLWHDELALQFIFEEDQLRQIGRSANFLLKLMQYNKKSYSKVMHVQHRLAWQGQEISVGFGQSQSLGELPSEWIKILSDNNFNESTKLFEVSANRYLIIGVDNDNIFQFFHYSDYTHYLERLLAEEEKGEENALY